MKKQLLIATVAATMSVVATADVSIKGDAHLRYAHSDNIDSTGQLVRLHVTGKSGDTKVKLGLRNDGGTRVSAGSFNTEGASEGSDIGVVDDGNRSGLNVDYLYLTTKVGGLNIKVGDWWDTTGLGVAREGKSDADRIEFSAKLSGWKLGLETGADSSSTVLSANGKVGDFVVKIEHDTAADGGWAGSGTPNATVGDYTDVSINGESGDLGIGAEYFGGNLDNGTDADAYVVHVWTKASDITWHFAVAETDAGVATLNGGNNKFSPLDISILGSSTDVNGNIAISDFGKTEDKVWGVRADAKVAGMGLQVATGKLELNNAAVDDSFWDVILTRSLGKASNIKFSIGDYNDVTSSGVKVSVKF